MRPQASRATPASPAANDLPAAVSVTLSLPGLELGNRIGAKTGQRGELLVGVVFIAVATGILQPPALAFLHDRQRRSAA